MKVRKNRIYPYPVLSVLNDSFLNNKFEADISFEYDSEKATIIVSTTIGDSVIVSYLNRNIVKLFCHVECSVTKYRNAFEIPCDKLNECRIDIPLSQLNGTVEIMCMLIAQDSFILDDPDLNDFYKGHVIIYPKYATVGYTETDEFNIIKTINVNGEIPSIFQISVNTTAEETSYECTNTYIVVYLSKEAHEQYYDLRGDFIRTKQIATNVTILTEIINDIKNGADYSGCAWYEVLDDRLKALGYNDGFNDSRIMSDDIQSVSLAEKILNYPLSDSFGELLDSKERGD